MKSIRARFMLVLTVGILFSLVSVALISGIAFRSHFDRYLEENILERHQRFLEFFAAEEGVFDQRGFIMTLNRLARMEEDLGVVVRNARGEIVFDSTGHMPMMRRGWIAAEEEGEVFSSSTRITAGGEEYEVTLMSRLGTEMWTSSEVAFQESIRRSLLIALGVSLSGALGLSVISAGKITRPINLLQQAAALFSRGKWETRVDLKTGDEIEALGETFNQMAGNIQHLEGLRRKMTSDLAHELHNPLMSIQNYIEGMQDGIIELDPEHLGELEEEVTRLIRLVGDLQRLARLESRRLEIEEFTPAEAFKGYMEKWKKDLKTRGQEFAWTITEGKFRGDQALIREILQNLLENAGRYTAPGDRIWCRMEVLDNGLDLEVGDTGPGISPEDQPNIFERFYRGQGNKKKGTGIGLAIVRELADLMNGRVELVSEENQGAVFKVFLPNS